MSKLSYSLIKRRLRECKKSNDNLIELDCSKPAMNDALCKAKFSLPVGKLAEAKRDALRRGVWFKVLNRVERGILDLTIRCVNNIRSAKLAKIVTAILDKLKLAMQSVVDRLVRDVGFSLAQKISDIAVSWGNRSARKWAMDQSFARYLVINSKHK